MSGMKEGEKIINSGATRAQDTRRKQLFSAPMAQDLPNKHTTQRHPSEYNHSSPESALSDSESSESSTIGSSLA
jgi:hypothetical protein